MVEHVVVHQPSLPQSSILVQPSQSNPKSRSSRSRRSVQFMSFNAQEETGTSGVEVVGELTANAVGLRTVVNSVGVSGAITPHVVRDSVLNVGDVFQYISPTTEQDNSTKSYTAVAIEDDVVISPVNIPTTVVNTNNTTSAAAHISFTAWDRLHDILRLNLESSMLCITMVFVCFGFLAAYTFTTFPLMVSEYMIPPLFLLYGCIAMPAPYISGLFYNLSVFCLLNCVVLLKV